MKLLSGETDPVEVAVGRGLAYLGRRDRSRRELERHLEEKGFEPQVSSAAAVRLGEMGYLDDARFASEFTACKRDLQGWGDERIRQRLLELGVDRDLVADVLASSGGREVERALAVLERRLVGPVDGESERRRAMGLLVRKGYSPETASDAIRIHRRLPSGSLGDLTA